MGLEIVVGLNESFEIAKLNGKKQTKIPKVVGPQIPVRTSTDQAKENFRLQQEFSEGHPLIRQAINNR